MSKSTKTGRYCQGDCGVWIDQTPGGGRPKKWCSSACKQRTMRRNETPEQREKRRAAGRARHARKKSEKPKRPRATCAECGKRFYLEFKQQRFCSEGCQFVEYRRLRDYRRLRGHRRRSGVDDAPIDVLTRYGVYQRDGWTCYICQKPTARQYSAQNPLSPTLDHIVPLERGGQNIVRNVRLAHAGCVAERQKAVV